MSRPVLIGLLVALVVALAGVGVYSVVVQSRSEPVAAPAPAAPAGVVLATAQSSLGTVVVDEGGFTLYRFDKDTPKPPKSNCNGDCATTWPPLLDTTGGAPQLTGIDPALVSTVVRADGSKQLTLNGWPLYRFSKDTAPGDTKGEGVGGTWHAIGVDGKLAVGAKGTAPTTKAAPKTTTRKPAPTNAPGGGGYSY